MKQTNTRVFSAPSLGARAVSDVTAEPVQDRSAEITFGSFKEGLRAIAGIAVPIAEKGLQEEGQAQAFRDVNEGQFEKRGGFSIRDQAYNRAGFEAMAGKIETQSAATVMELSRKHAADPDGYKVAVEAYAHGMSSELMALNPVLATEMKNRTLTRAIPYMERLGQQKANQVKDQSEAALLQYDAQFDALMDDVSGDLFSGNAKLSAAAVQQIETLAGTYLAEMNRVGEDGLPVYGEADRERARQAFFGRAIEEGLAKWFRDTPDIARAILTFSEGELSLAMGGDVLDVSAMLKPEARIRVLRIAEAELTDRNTRRKAEDKAQDDLTENAQKLRYFQMTDAMLGGALDPNTVRQGVANQVISPAAGRSLLQGIQDIADAPAVSDESMVRTVTEMMYGTGQDPTEIILRNLDRFSPSDTQSLLGKARVIFAPSGDQTGMTQEQNRYFQLLGESIKVGGPLGAIDTDAQIRITSAKDEFLERVVIGQEPPRDVFLDLRERARGASIEFSPTSKLVKPRFSVMGGDGRLDLTASARALQARQGELTADQFREQMRLLTQWNIALQEQEATQ